MPVDERRVPTIALIDWSHLIEDFLDGLDVSFETFQKEFRGSWIFGYIDALRLAGMGVVWFCVSARVVTPARFTHLPTGATICLLPAPKAYRLTRRLVLNPYATSVQQAVGEVNGLSRALIPLLKDAGPYLATPLRLFARELRREDCSAILCQEYEHARFDASVFLGKLMRLPVFATFQGGDTHLSRFEKVLRPFTLRACAGIIISTRSEARRVQARYNIPAGKIAQIFNPIDLGIWRADGRREARAALGIPSDARVAVWHGRIDLYRKGLDVLLQAWQQLYRNRMDRNLRLLLVGTGNEAEGLRRRIADMRLDGVLWIDKFIHEPPVLRLYLSAGNLYVFPSRHEGFPVAPIEAMACGLPIVAANTPGLSDILDDGESSGGLLVPGENAAAFSQALERLLYDETLASELGKRGQHWVATHFSLTSVAEQLRSFLLKGGVAINRSHAD